MLYGNLAQIYIFKSTVTNTSGVNGENCISLGIKGSSILFIVVGEEPFTVLLSFFQTVSS